MGFVLALHVLASVDPWSSCIDLGQNACDACCVEGGLYTPQCGACVCRCVLQALQVLHQAGFAHTDVRWENVIWHTDQYVLIDLEFACELNTCPFTPGGESLCLLGHLWEHHSGTFDLLED